MAVEAQLDGLHSVKKSDVVAAISMRPATQPTILATLNASDSHGPITRINSSDDTGIFRDAYRPE